ncbi:hypothetical protein COOONC_07679 [Cooperia oncophora]
MFRYSHAGAFPRSPYELWAAPPAAQGTPRSSRAPLDQSRSRRVAGEGQPVGFPPAAMQKGAQGPPPVVPPYMYSRDPREGLVGQAASNQIASGLDALNLNQKNPELMSAAWNAFFKTLSSGTAAAQPRKQHW